MLSKNSGLYEVKPFKDWRTTAWCEKVFTMRLCNAGEILDIMSYCNTVPELGRIQATKFEILIRSIFHIDGRTLITDEELESYNRLHDTALSKLEYLRFWVRNLEQVVVDRLDAVYGGLQHKQDRLLRQKYICGSCGMEFSELPKDCVELKYSIADMICDGCIKTVEPEYFDMVNVEIITEEPEPTEDGNTDTLEEDSYVCSDCNEKFPDYEKFEHHRKSHTESGVV